MNADKIIENFRKENSYKIGFVEGIVHVLFVLNQSVGAVIQQNTKFENAATIGNGEPELVLPMTNGNIEYITDILKHHPPIALNIDIQEEIRNSEFMKQLIERLKDEKSPV